MRCEILRKRIKHYSSRVKIGAQKLAHARGQKIGRGRLSRKIIDKLRSRTGTQFIGVSHLTRALACRQRAARSTKTAATFIVIFCRRGGKKIRTHGFSSHRTSCACAYAYAKHHVTPGSDYLIQRKYASFTHEISKSEHV